ncbi:hypothetical protein JQ506_22000 [Shinella sp. PSBB067]|uniref:BRO-N domain-containing protein n=1 Tax=Shinella sp. PSBB067 TaxID=2715959 RepID=UPI00193B3680|nr:BRO family protein [Shinella sp. PSBB067]QRI63448.1 hypothetical protein JQ506_22000 [Shinella sp. PSBB067]
MTVLYRRQHRACYSARVFNRRLAKDEQRLWPVASVQTTRKMKLISESGLYKLVMRSDKPEARAFQDWVTKECLPSIRKHGG